MSGITDAASSSGINNNSKGPPAETTTPDIETLHIIGDIPGKYFSFQPIPGENAHATLTISEDGTYRYDRSFQVAGIPLPPPPPPPTVITDSGRWSLISTEPARIKLASETGTSEVSLLFTGNELIGPDTPGFGVFSREGVDIDIPLAKTDPADPPAAL
jgi:hypothetical protein